MTVKAVRSPIRSPLRHPVRLSLIPDAPPLLPPAITIAVSVASLTATATITNTGGAYASLSINWGDGTTNGSLTHTYAGAGVYAVTATATNAAGSSTATGMAFAGALAEYRFDEGSGTTLIDHSANSYNGTLGAGGAAPTWVAAGLSFNGSNRVDVPVPIGSVKTVLLYGTANSGNAYNPIVSSDSASGLSWFMRSAGVVWPLSPQLYFGGEINTCYDPMRPAGAAAFTHDGVSDKFYVNGGRQVFRTTFATNSANTGRVGNLVIGLSPQYPQGLSGVLSGLILFDVALPASQIVTGSAALQAVATSRGLLPYANAGTVRQVYCEGDSITVGVGTVTTPWPAGMTLARTWTRVNQSLSGQTMVQITGSIRQRTLIEYATGAPKNVVVIFAGTNDFVGSGSTAAATFAQLQTAVGYAVAAGWTTVIVPMLSRSNPGADAFKNSYNGMIYGASWAASVSLVPAASMPHLVPDGSYANTTYFQDDPTPTLAGVHPTQVGTNEIGTAVAAVLDSLG